ncbi:MAG: hypothetical protein LBS49_12155 [Candidatus Accumulibacter sp.]|nr:hypothetical protein [Accumulibacter sp.]
MLSLTALVLSACGGGGGGHGDSDQPSTPDPVNPGLVGGPIVISHRGASGYLPEHTLAAYELAIQMGADYIEPDLQFTKDGHLVAMHDDTLDQNTNVADLFAKRNGHNNYPVSDFTLAEIRTLTVTYSDAGTAKGSYPGYTPSDARYNGFGIPTFDEVIEFAKAQSAKVGREIGIYPEAKQADPEMEDGILATLSAHGMNKPDSRVFIQSFSEETIRSLHGKQQAQGTKVPQILLGVAVMKDGVPKMGVWRDLVGWSDDSIEALDFSEVKKIADGVSVGLGDPYYTDGFPVTREFIEQAHAAGLRVHGWTFSQVDAIAAQKEYREYLDMGMDGMFSNYPDLAVLARDQFKEPIHKFVSDGPQVTSHRGASGYLPEHTFAAYELAIKMGVDFIEPDLQTTSDGVLVVMHDTTLDGNTNVTTSRFSNRGGSCINPSDDTDRDGVCYYVSDFTLAEIRELTVTNSDAGTAETSYPGYTPSDTSYNSFRIPTFDEVVDFAKAQSAKYDRPIGIYPEAKQADPLMEDRILATLATKGLPSTDVPVIIQSFSGDTIKSLHDKQVAQGKNIPQILLGLPIMDNGIAKIVLTSQTTLPVDGTVPNYGFPIVNLATVKSVADGISLSIDTASLGLPMSKEFVKQAHDAGLLVHAWTFNKVDAFAAAEEYYNYLDMGLDGFFSNYPNLGVMARDWFLRQQSSN